MGTAVGRRAGWLPAARRRHVLTMAPITLACAAAFVFASPPTGGWQLLVLAAAVAIFGLPHGALDHLLGRRLLQPRLGGWWPLLFGLGYLALAAGVVGGWLAVPSLMLVLFLAYSAWHFGAGDDGAPGRSGVEAVLLSAARGLLPIALPALFHAGEVTVYFNYLLPEGQALAAGLVRMIAGLTVAVALPASLAAIALTPARQTGEAGRRRRDLIEVGVLILLFACAPPLVSFLIYFCGWHSLRHLLDLGAQLSPDDPRRAAAGLARSAWPLTLVTVAAAWPAWRLLIGAGLGADAALAQVLFIGLAALTVPHMVLCSLASRQAGREGSSA